MLLQRHEMSGRLSTTSPAALAWRADSLCPWHKLQVFHLLLYLPASAADRAIFALPAAGFLPMPVPLMIISPTVWTRKRLVVPLTPRDAGGETTRSPFLCSYSLRIFNGSRKHFIGRLRRTGKYGKYPISGPGSVPPFPGVTATTRAFGLYLKHYGQYTPTGLP